MLDRARRYYFGSYGIIRGFGPLFRTIEEADRSVFKDASDQRKRGGSSDRNAVAVRASDGTCWWTDDGDDIRENELKPVRMADGSQATYAKIAVSAMEATCRKVKKRA